MHSCGYQSIDEWCLYINNLFSLRFLIPEPLCIWFVTLLIPFFTLVLHWSGVWLALYIATIWVHAPFVRTLTPATEMTGLFYFAVCLSIRCLFGAIQQSVTTLLMHYNTCDVWCHPYYIWYNAEMFCLFKLDHVVVVNGKYITTIVTCWMYL